MKTKVLKVLSHSIENAKKAAAKKYNIEDISVLKAEELEKTTKNGKEYTVYKVTVSLENELDAKDTSTSAPKPVQEENADENKISVLDHEKEDEFDKAEKIIKDVQNIKNISNLFSIESEENKYFLKLHTPEIPDKDVEDKLINTIYLDLISKGITRVKKTDIKTKIDEYDDERILLFEKKADVYKDAQAKVVVSDDNIHAYFKLIPPKADGIEMIYEKAIKEIEKIGIVDYNIDVVKEAVAKKIYNQEIEIATGIEPVPPTNGIIEYNFDTEHKNLPKKVEDDATDRVDYHELNLIQNVVAGQLLATIIEPIPGKPGKDVFGKMIEPDSPKPASFKPGKNVELSENEKELLASIDGRVELMDNKISVLPIYEVHGDVDLNVGNITFLGEVIIHGNVLQGFSIKASGNVLIYGTVSSAHVESEKNIKINKGIVGKNDCTVSADGNVIVKFIENSTVNAGKNVIVAEAIMHSQVDAGKHIYLNGKKALIVGGLLRAGNDISAKTIGSVVSTLTQIQAGVNPIIRRKIMELTEERKKAMTQYNKVEKGIMTLLKIQKKLGKLPEEKKQTLTDLKEIMVQLKEKIEYDEKKQDELELQLQRSKKGMISVKDKVYANVKISIKNATHHTKDNNSFCSFIYGKGEVEMVKYRTVKLTKEDYE